MLCVNVYFLFNLTLWQTGWGSPGAGWREVTRKCAWDSEVAPILNSMWGKKRWGLKICPGVSPLYDPGPAIARGLQSLGKKYNTMNPHTGVMCHRSPSAAWQSWLQFNSCSCWPPYVVLSASVSSLFCWGTRHLVHQCPKLLSNHEISSHTLARLLNTRLVLLYNIATYI